MQLSSSAVVETVQELLDEGNYPEAYQVILNDLNSQNLTLSADDQSVLTFLTDAIQINSGSTTSNASIAVRANNVAAEQVENGISITMFGPQNQASSNAVAQAFLTNVVSNNGLIPPINTIAQEDAGAGLGALHLSPGAWSGAVPDGLGIPGTQ